MNTYLRWLRTVGEWAVLLPLWRRFFQQTWQRVMAAVGIGLLWLVVISVAAGGGGGDDANDDGTGAPSETAEASTTPAKSVTPKPTAKPTATAEPTPGPTAEPTLAPTLIPTPKPTPAPTAKPTQPPTQPPAYDYACEANASCNCPDFPTHAEAQRIFELHSGSPTNNWAGLDNDHDGIACESLP